jgi:tetratricopeptide (TPR) repeat protein
VSRLSRRRALHAATSLALAAASPFAGAQDTRLPGSFDAWRRRLDERNGVRSGEPGPDALLIEGEALLAAGDADAALDVLQQAANLAHTPQIECTVTRAQVQAGAYRQALAFGAHAALSHRAYPSAMALYAWLLHVGGQSVIAARLLDDALQRAPDAMALRLARDELARAWPRPSGPLLDAPLRSAPHAHGAVVPTPGVAVLGTAVLLADGRHALVARETLAGATHCWLRNGLGRTVHAEPAVPAGDWALLRLADPLPAAALDASHAPLFAGSPIATCEYAPMADDLPAWPVLRQGFAGRVPAQGARALGIVMPSGARGGPVFDRAGRLAGVSRGGLSGDRLVAAAELPLDFPVDASRAAEPVPLDVVYESALRLTLQVIAARTA